jgi:hypothetical protein
MEDNFLKIHSENKIETLNKFEIAPGLRQVSKLILNSLWTKVAG